MRKGWLIAVGLALLVVLSGMISCANGIPPEPESGAGANVISSPGVSDLGKEEAIDNTPGESDFNLIFRYGIMAKNILDTFQGTYSKDMVRDPNIMIHLLLSDEEMDRIYQKMVEIDFFNYPDQFSISAPPGVPVGISTPYSSYYFKVEHDAGTKELWWHDEIVYKDYADEKADRLRELIGLIRDIVESKEEYEELPPPTGAYL